MDDASLPLLPVLTEPELRAIFREDERAIWRYHLLADLLHAGRSSRAVAEQWGTTPETVRHLRNAFLQTGHLDVLRSRRRGAAGHLQRQTPLAHAIARELALDPGASGGQIWRSVRSQLAASGVDAPRRTVYRLIERLRPGAQLDQTEAESELWAPALVPLLRSALPFLQWEPPVDLGRSQLAEQVLADEPEPVARGRILREMLKHGLAEMRPGDDDDPQDPSFRPYQILQREALQGTTREELQRDLAIAPATYTRAKRQGLERLAEILVAKVQQRKPPERALAPAAPPLLGRDREIAYYTRRLEEEGVALIWGLPGSGKTALAATIAGGYQPRARGVVWHECDEVGEGILRSLLASFGRDYHPLGLDTARLLVEIREEIMRADLLVLERYDVIAADPVADLLLATLRAVAGAGGARLLVVSRVLPRWAENQGWGALGGIADEAARALWTMFGGATIEPPAWSPLYNRTLGYPWLIQALAADAGADLDPLLLDCVAQDLSDQARAVLSRALLVRQPLRATDETLELAAAQPRSTPLAELVGRGLLCFDQVLGCYHLHGLLEAHRAGLRPLVTDAPSIYISLRNAALDQKRWLDAAHYQAAAGEILDAVRVVGQHLHELIAERQGANVIVLLRELLPRLAPGADLAEGRAHLGTLYLLLGDYSQAIDTLHTAIDLANVYRAALPDDQVRRWHRRLAEAYVGTGHWRHALEQAQVSMGGERTITTGVPAAERIELTLLQHRIWLLAGRPDQARFWLADAQMQLLASPTPRANVLVAWAEGMDAAQGGAWRLAMRRLQVALDGLPPNADHAERFRIVAQLARCLMVLDKLDDARVLLRRTLTEAQVLQHRAGTARLALALVEATSDDGDLAEAWSALGLVETLHDEANLRRRAELHLARAWLSIRAGNVVDAQPQFDQALARAVDPPLPEVQARANVGLAMLHLQRGDATTAGHYALRGARYAESAGIQRHRVLAYLCLTEEATLRRAWDEAERYMDQASVEPEDRTLHDMVERVRSELLAAKAKQNVSQATVPPPLHNPRTDAAIERGPTGQSHRSTWVW